MVTRKGIQNEITLPEVVVTQFRGVEYFDVSTDGACIILRPVDSQATEVRSELSALDLSEADVHDAVAWSRQQE